MTLEPAESAEQGFVEAPISPLAWVRRPLQLQSPSAQASPSTSPGGALPRCALQCGTLHTHTTTPSAHQHQPHHARREGREEEEDGYAAAPQQPPQPPEHGRRPSGSANRGPNECRSLIGQCPGESPSLSWFPLLPVTRGFSSWRRTLCSIWMVIAWL